jgi:uncharacterized small protein (DUF1192 family)
MVTTIRIGNHEIKKRLKDELDDDIRGGKTVGGLGIKSSDQDRIEYLLNFHRDAFRKYVGLGSNLKIQTEVVGNLNDSISILKSENSRLKIDLEKKRVEIKKLEDEKNSGRWDELGGV